MSGGVPREKSDKMGWRWHGIMDNVEIMGQFDVDYICGACDWPIC